MQQTKARGTAAIAGQGADESPHSTGCGYFGKGYQPLNQTAAEAPEALGLCLIFLPRIDKMSPHLQ